MKNSQTKWPEKFLSQLFDTHRAEGEQCNTQLYIIFDTQTSLPQAFEVFKRKPNEHCLGSLCNADFDVNENAPALIVDKETALFLISQSAIAYTLDEEWTSPTQPLYGLMPVFGAMIPECLPKKQAI